MKKSKLIELLGALPKEEIKEFGKFLKRTSSVKSHGKLWLFDYLKKYHPEFPEAKVDRKFIAKKIKTALDLSEKSLANLMTNLYVDIENYFIEKELQLNAVDRNFILLKALKRNKLDKLFFNKVEQIQKEWKTERPKGIEQLHNEYKLAKTCFMHPNYSLFPGQDIDPHLLLEKIDTYYFAVKLYYNLCIESTQYTLDRMQSLNYKNLIIPILELIRSSKTKNTPQLQFFTLLLEDYHNKKFDNYINYKNLFFESYDVFDSNEAHDIITFLQIAVYENYKLGKAGSLQELFELNKFAAEKHLILENGYVSEFSFKNIVLTACAAKEISWAETFVEEFGEYLDKNVKEDISQLCKAILEFNKGNFELSLEYLLTVKLPDAVYGIQMRCLQLQCYYEVEKYEELFYNLVKSFSTYLSRNDKLSDTYKEAWQNFIRYANKLKQAQFNNKNKKEKLHQEITAHTNISSKTWLLEKAEKLYKKQIH